MTEKSNTLLPATPWGCLPPRMQLLSISGTHDLGRWLADAFATDSATSIQLSIAVGASDGLKMLRDDSFDVVLIGHRPPELDALELLDAIRAGGSDQLPTLVLGDDCTKQMAALCFDAGADGYVCLRDTTTRTLIWQVARASERHQLIAENRRLTQYHRHRLQLEHDEADRLLMQQRSLIHNLELIRRNNRAVGDHIPTPGVHANANRCPDLPAELTDHYTELLRTYVIMGSGGLVEEMNRLAELLVSSNVTAQQAMQLHLHVLEDLVHDLGARSARHVMNRADLLILEVLVHVAEGFRQRSAPRNYRSSDTLPGIELDQATA